ncbi:hypothetical protein COT20_02465 [bacterium (Candidatus Gribaldobacteria) CG08_land_8_20_14_0_20_39_15]|uniref:Uncharacterized protein n=1 Tax=bacterium (Candidatus Gribaldobacteria) CG08_land_8_20_14_0_20_39_15 TaxID=2014273 RepID=A0A2M6XU00_9BACT|nr:MAG: hypothetical protein COT20_02465 [bacterium (Candidatus Gribaldobacteria) CG08_land_8_20_14_0_20_39_15]
MLHFKSSVTHYNGDTTIYNYDPLHPPSNIISDIAHPPLSIRIEGRGPGVTLYAAIGGARTFSASEEDFSYSNVKFDNAADEIELNNLDNDGGKIHDYLAILHNDYNYTGDLRIFFERREDDNPTDPPPALFLPKIYLDGFSEPNMQEYETNIAFVPGDCSLYCGDSSVDNDPLLNPPNCEAGDPFDSLNPTHFLSFYYFYNNETVDAMSVSAMPTLKQQKGEPPPIYSARAPINKQDRLGRLKDGNKTSSIEIFELENQIVYRDNQGQTSFSSIKKNVACEEVTLCTGKMYLNNCIVFVPNHQDYLADKFNSPSRYDSVILPMPLYVPVNIPKTIKNGLVKIKDEDTGESKMERKNIDFADKIKSLEIKGDCAVVLFENSVKDIADCAQCQFDQKNNPTDDAVCKKCWDNGPGANSEVFTESVGDLTTHSISKCGGREKFGFGERKNCASAIAIFPLKKTD